MAPTLLPSDEDVTIEVGPWCNHWDLATDTICRKPPSRAQGSTDANGLTAHVCTDGRSRPSLKAYPRVAAHASRRKEVTDALKAGEGRENMRRRQRRSRLDIIFFRGEW